MATDKPRRKVAANREMKIRDARDADLPAIIRIYNAAIVTRISTAQLETGDARGATQLVE